MSMAANPAIMRAVETLGYRVTTGDVASQAGLDVKLVERDLLALASEAGGHMQVTESGEIAYLFPRHFRDILRSKSWRLRWQERLGKVWNFIFYLIRISFGIYINCLDCADRDRDHDHFGGAEQQSRWRQWRWRLRGRIHSNRWVWRELVLFLHARLLRSTQLPAAGHFQTR